MSPRFFTTLRSVLNDKNNKGMIIYMLTSIVIQSEAKDLVNIHMELLRFFLPSVV